MVILLLAVDTDDFVVVAVVARTPVRSRVAVVRRSRLLLLLAVVGAIVTAGIIRFSVPILPLSLRAKLYSLDLRLVFFDCGDSLCRIPDLGLVTGKFKCPGKSGWFLLRHNGSQILG